MRFTILGRTRLLAGEYEVPLGHAKQRALLTLLLAKLDTPVAVDTIVGQLWRGRDRDEVRDNLNTLVSRVRTTLRRAGVPHSLEHDADAYRLRLDPELVDYYRFRRLAASGKAAVHEGDHVRARRLLTEAVDLWGGTPLVDLRTPWAEQRIRQMVDHDFLPTNYLLLGSELSLGEHADVLRRLAPLMDEWPLDEILARRYMQALDGLGRFGEATDFYTRFRRRLLDEYGAEPGPDLREVHDQVQRRRAPIARPPARGAAANAASSPAELGVPWALPRRAGNFTGRDDLLAELDALFARADTGGHAPVVALHGMPGVGKTTLAVNWAHRRRDRFPDGFLFLDLNGLGPGRPTTAEDAVTILLGALDVPDHLVPAASGQRRARLSRLLAERRLLIILDNVRDDQHARPLLLTMPDSALLITSRARLTELVVRDAVQPIMVSPLSIDQSAALLRLEIGEARVREDPRSLYALAKRSYGLPLAIKVIGQYAANRPHSPLAEVVHEFDGHAGQALTADADDEAATLWRAFALSYHALSPERARLFRLLGLHPRTTFSSPVAAALAGTDRGVTEQQLRALAKVHLLQPEGLDRYRLHDLLYAYAAGRAAREEPADQRITALTRMVDWYLRTATEALRRLVPHAEPVPPVPASAGVTPLRFDTEAEALRWHTQERANLIAVTRCAAEHGLHSLTWRIPVTVDEAFERSGFHDDFFEVLPIALESARAAGDQEAEVGLLNLLGRTAFGRHDHRRALEHLQAGLALATEIDSRLGLSVIQHNLACIYLEIGQVTDAVRLYQDTLELNRRHGDREGEAFSLNRLANTYRRLGRYDQALAHYREALQIRESIGHTRGQGSTLTELCLLFFERGDRRQALEYGRLALAVHERTGDKARAAQTLLTLAAIRYEAASVEEAVTDARRAVELCEVTKDPVALAQALHVLGHALLAVGDHAAARHTWSRAVDVDGAEDRQVHAMRAHLGSLEETGEHAGYAVPRPRSAGDDRMCDTALGRIDQPFNSL